MVVKLVCLQDQTVFTKYFTATIELMATKCPTLPIIKLVGVTLFGIAIVTIMLSRKVKFGAQHLVDFNNSNMTKNILLILVILCFTSCRWFSSASTPYFSFTNFKVPEGTPTFQKGFKDGCSTVLYARGNDWYRSRYHYRYDPTMIGNTEYRFGHARGYTWCFQNILSQTTGHGTLDKFLFPHGADSMTGGLDYNPNNINAQGLFGAQGAAANPLATSNNSLDDMMGVWQKGTNAAGEGGAGATVFGTNPLWAGGSSGWWLGWY